MIFSDFLSYFFDGLALPDYVLAFGSLMVLGLTCRVLVTIVDKVLR